MTNTVAKDNTNFIVTNARLHLALFNADSLEILVCALDKPKSEMKEKRDTKDIAKAINPTASNPKYLLTRTKVIKLRIGIKAR